jgi:hypothetical protein
MEEMYTTRYAFRKKNQPSKNSLSQKVIRCCCFCTCEEWKDKYNQKVIMLAAYARAGIPVRAASMASGPLLPMAEGRGAPAASL